MGPSHPIAAYTGARASETQHVDVINGAQPGDPAKLAAALIATYEKASLPLHLFLGSDAVRMSEVKQKAVHADIETQRSLSLSTDS